MEKDYQEIQVDFEENCTLSGLPAKWAEISFASEGKKAQGLLYVTVKERKGYVLFFAASENQFNKWKPKFEQIKETFQIV